MRNKLIELSYDGSANWVVQECVSNVRDIPQYVAIFEELYPELLQLLDKGRAGVVCQLVQVSLKFPQKQKEILKLFQDHFTSSNYNLCQSFLELRQFSQVTICLTILL
jgi:hypothetical protein